MVIQNAVLMLTISTAFFIHMFSGYVPQYDSLYLRLYPISHTCLMERLFLLTAFHGDLLITLLGELILAELPEVTIQVLEAVLGDPVELGELI